MAVALFASPCRPNQSLISEVRIHNVTALLSMEEIKSTTMLPLGVE